LVVPLLQQMSLVLHILYGAHLYDHGAGENKIFSRIFAEERSERAVLQEIEK